MSQTFEPEALTELFALEEDTPGLVQSLVNDFVRVSLKLSQDIMNAMAKGDFSTLEMGAHSLKSSSKVLGLNQLANVCFEIESAAHHKKLAPAAISQIPQLRDVALTAITDFLKARG